MDKKQYAIQLASRLVYMIEENEIHKFEYEEIKNKLPKWNYHDPIPYKTAYDKLTLKEREIYNVGPVKFSDSAIRRVRIELNKILIELYGVK